MEAAEKGSVGGSFSLFTIILVTRGKSRGADAPHQLLLFACANVTPGSYSPENLLTTVNAPTWSRRLYYDPLMRLYQPASVLFAYDGDTRIAEYHADGSGQTNRFVHGPGADEPLVEYGGTGLATRHFLHADERGSIIASSNDAGNVMNVGRYDENGKVQSYASRFGLAGMPIESVSGLYYARARMYNPRLGRFMQPDPIGYEDGPNLYAYVGNDPVNNTDPSGMAEEPIIVTGRRIDWEGYANFVKGFLHTPLLPRRIELPRPVLRAMQAVTGASEDCLEITAPGACTLEEMISIGSWVPGGALAGKVVQIGTSLYRINVVARGVSRFLGAGAVVKVNSPFKFVAVSSDGMRRFRIDKMGHGGNAPHAHLEQKIGGKFRDVAQHRIYLRSK